MPTPSNGYYLKDGSKVPGTTTVIGRFKDSGGLIQWAYKQGREHEGLARLGKEAPRHLYDVTQQAADIGTLGHAMVEAHIHGADPETAVAEQPEEVAQKARQSFGAYLNWERTTNVKILAQEMQLVSEEYKFGGTPDAIGTIGNELCLLDWKTSNGIYSDYLIQLAAYRHLWEENHPDQPLTGGFHLCRFAKEHGDFAHHYYPDLSDGWEAFVHMRALYDIDKRLKQRAR